MLTAFLTSMALAAGVAGAATFLCTIGKTKLLSISLSIVLGAMTGATTAYVMTVLLWGRPPWEATSDMAWRSHFADWTLITSMVVALLVGSFVGLSFRAGRRIALVVLFTTSAAGSAWVAASLVSPYFSADVSCGCGGMPVPGDDRLRIIANGARQVDVTIVTGRSASDTPVSVGSEVEYARDSAASAPAASFELQLKLYGNAGESVNFALLFPENLGRPVDIATGDALQVNAEAEQYVPGVLADGVCRASAEQNRSNRGSDIRHADELRLGSDGTITTRLLITRDPGDSLGYYTKGAVTYVSAPEVAIAIADSTSGCALGATSGEAFLLPSAASITIEPSMGIALADEVIQALPLDTLVNGKEALSWRSDSTGGGANASFAQVAAFAAEASYAITTPQARSVETASLFMAALLAGVAATCIVELGAVGLGHRPLTAKRRGKKPSRRRQAESDAGLSAARGAYGPDDGAVATVPSTEAGAESVTAANELPRGEVEASPTSVRPQPDVHVIRVLRKTMRRIATLWCQLWPKGRRLRRRPMRRDKRRSPRRTMRD